MDGASEGGSGMVCEGTVGVGGKGTGFNAGAGGDGAVVGAPDGAYVEGSALGEYLGRVSRGFIPHCFSRSAICSTVGSFTALESLVMPQPEKINAHKAA